MAEAPHARQPPLNHEPPALAIEGASFAYGGRPAVSDIDLRVPVGHLMALVGPNGAGKTTLGQLAAGLRRPHSGTVQLFGRDAREHSSRELATTVGYVFQNPEHQFVRQTVFDELAFGLQVLGEDPVAIRARVESLLDGFGLLEHAWANPFSLSQGQKRRLSVATQLITGRRLLVLDEPTLGQDPHTAAALMGQIASLQHQGRTVLMVTHDVELVSAFATLVAVLVEGRLRYVGSPSEVFEASALLESAALEPPAMWAIARHLREHVRPCIPAASSN